jgi:UPF0271 protein
MMRIDLNADMGEGFGVWRLGDDAGLLGSVSSANVACGFHAGDPSIIAAVCAGAAQAGVAIGAQVSYRDLIGFGRRRLDVPPDELVADIVYQLGAVQALARAAGTAVTYLKPHGALYNAAAVDSLVAGCVVRALVAAEPSLPVLCQPGLVLARAASDAGLPVAFEAFADRGYAPDGTLIPRGQPGALLPDEAAVVERCLRLVSEDEIVAVDGTVLRQRVDSVCVHGDTPGAVDLARAIRAAFAEGGVAVAPFAPLDFSAPSGPSAPSAPPDPPFGAS